MVKALCTSFMARHLVIALILKQSKIILLVVPEMMSVLAGIVAKPLNAHGACAEILARVGQLVFEMVEFVREAHGNVGFCDRSDTVRVLLNGENNLQDASDPREDVVGMLCRKHLSFDFVMCYE